MIPYGKGILITKIEVKDSGVVDGVYVPSDAMGDGKKRGIVFAKNMNNSQLKREDKIIYEGDESGIIGDDKKTLFLINEDQIKVIL